MGAIIQILIIIIVIVITAEVIVCACVKVLIILIMSWNSGFIGLIGIVDHFIQFMYNIQ